MKLDIRVKLYVTGERAYESEVVPWAIERPFAPDLSAGGFSSLTPCDDGHGFVSRVKPSSLQSSLPTPWWTKNRPSESYRSLIARSFG